MDWAARIKRAERKGEFTAVDRRLAGQWLTCAVGEKTYVKGRTSFDAIPGSQLDQLHTLGLLFMGEVESNKIEAAKETYQQIQNC